MGLVPQLSSSMTTSTPGVSTITIMYIAIQYIHSKTLGKLLYLSETQFPHL